MKKATLTLMCLILAAGLIIMVSCTGGSSAPGAGKANVALLAQVLSFGRGGQTAITTLNDGQIPDSVPAGFTQRFAGQSRQGRPQRPAVIRYECRWEKPVTIDETAVFWYDYDSLVKLPHAYRFRYWNGTDFVPVENPEGLELRSGVFCSTRFAEVTTTSLQIEIDSVQRFMTPALEWMVFKSKGSPDVAPVINAGDDRSVITGGKTYLSAEIKSVGPLKDTRWTAEGPGPVQFADPAAKETAASFTVPGEYILTLTSSTGKMSSSSSLNVKALLPPEEKRLDVVYTKKYKIDNPLWTARAKALITNWIPHCIRQIERTDLPTGQGGLDNFIEAAKALRGEPHGRHLGYVFSNAWVHQTIESMCIALMVDAGRDREIMAAQEYMKLTLEKWIPIVLAAQEPDGYLHTAYTLRDTTRWKERWAPETRGNHEGYVAGYFIESAINHYTLTEGRDKRLYDAARKLADCWVANLGPGKKEWYDGHQEMEQALVRFGRFVNDMEGNGSGDSYIALAKFLLDNRRGGSEYDQSHVPVQQQYEAVGHAVRAVYNYSAMADVAAETGDIDYQSAVISLWDNIVNKKYYLTGGIGSGETSEGFGDDYSLGNNAYCEACSSCGLIFFQYKMNLAYHDAMFADLYEETMYNALLGSMDLQGKNFFYDNPLSSGLMRYDWHVCPCCVGNIPRTLLMVPTWTYVKSENGIYVNMYIGSTIKVEKVAGTDVEMVQKTDYPWSGKVSITVNPESSARFTLYVRVPDRKTSNLYTPVPGVNTLKSLTVNGKAVPVNIVKGYAEIPGEWKKGDEISLEIPMEVQVITADERILADRGRVALRYGPMIYNVEKADQPDINGSIGSTPLKAEWKPGMLGGIIAVSGTWADGSPLLAVPNFARLNRPVERTEGDRTPTSIVWIRK
ncbi:MAG: glycoside hydrolase family 127 protein [Bacteroidales bacterium]|nr:glycoside hydrolase family 127 protein [Bacteroidales bacterium]